MTDNAIRDALEALLQDTHAGEQETQSIEQLSRSEPGRSALAAWRWLSEGASSTTPLGDFSASVLADLPPAGSPRTWARLAELVLEGWADPGYRAALRRDARGALAERGLQLPEGLSLEIVAPEAASLPDGRRVYLPLPAPNRPAVTAALAMRELEDTAFAWLWGPPWARGATAPKAAATAAAPVEARSMAPGGIARLRSWWASLGAGPQLAFAIGAILICAIGLDVMQGDTSMGGNPLLGTAIGGDLAWPSMLGLAAGLGLVAWALWSGRR